MEAHKSYERFEHDHRLAGAGESDAGAHHGRNAALVVAVMAAFLAIASFLSNEAVKEVITGETHRAETSSRLEGNLVKIDIADGNSEMLRVLGAGTAGRQQRAAATSRAHEAHIKEELRPVDAHLRTEIADHEKQVEHANTQHVDYELAEVGLQVGIVLASVSIIARRRWLLGAGGAAASAGVALLFVGLLA